MLFDVQAALAEILSAETLPAISAIPAISRFPNSGNSRSSDIPPAEIGRLVLPFAPNPSVPDDGDASPSVKTAFSHLKRAHER